MNFSSSDRPIDTENIVSQGVNAMNAGRFEDALSFFSSVESQLYSHPALQLNIGICHYHLGNLVNAQHYLEAACSLAPGLEEVQNALGAILIAKGDLSAALATFKFALNMHPNSAMLLSNIGLTYKELGSHDEAEDSLRRALKIAPNDSAAHNNLALVLLSKGKYREAWAHHVYRTHNGNAKTIASIQQLSTQIIGKDMCLVGEQGIGDELFFLRYAPLIKKVAGKIRLITNPKLGRILAECGIFDNIYTDSTPSTHSEITIFVGDLPLLLQTSVSLFPPPLTIATNPNAILSQRTRLGDTFGHPIIGLTWRAGPVKSTYSSVKLQKSIPLDNAFSALPENCVVVILQRFILQSEIDYILNHSGTRRVVFASDVNDDLTQAAALLSQLDDYVTVSNTLLHLHAGLGKRAHVLIPYPYEWRWAQPGDSPWFPTCLTYKQLPDGDWSKTIFHLRDDLKRIYESY